jgi:hypothetical protein
MGKDKDVKKENKKKPSKTLKEKKEAKRLKNPQRYASVALPRPFFSSISPGYITAS